MVEGKGEVCTVVTDKQTTVTPLHTCRGLLVYPLDISCEHNLVSHARWGVASDLVYCMMCKRNVIIDCI